MTCWLPLLSGYRLTWQDFMNADLEILAHCDALFYIGPSKGADIELTAAEKWGLTVYHSLDDVPWAQDFVFTHPRNIDWELVGDDMLESEGGGE